MISHVHNLRKMNLFIGKLELMINDEKIDAMAFDNFESVNAFLIIKLKLNHWFYAFTLFFF